MFPSAVPSVGKGALASLGISGLLLGLRKKGQLHSTPLTTPL